MRRARLSRGCCAAGWLVAFAARAAAPLHPDLEAVEAMVIAQTNELRAAEGLGTLAAQRQLDQAARAFAQYLANGGAFAHESGGTTPETRVRERGYQFCVVAENLERQYSTQGFTTKELAQKLVQGWKDSPGHRHNMLEPDALDTAVAIAHRTHDGVEDFYAVQLFARKESTSIQFKVRNASGNPIVYRVGGKRFTLEPNWVRAHGRCASPDLDFDGRGHFTPANGDCLVMGRDAAVRREPGGCG